MNSLELQSSDDIRELYRELILDHARSPRHFGRLDSATHSAQGINPLCGDKLELFLKIDADDVIEDATFEGTGCAISVASASLLTDLVIGHGTEKALQYFRDVTDRLTGSAKTEASAPELEKLRALDGVREYPSRVKCATLAWHALQSAIRQRTSPATTE